MTPTLLALESSTWRASVGLLHQGRMLTRCVADDGQKNSDVMMPMVHEVLAEMGIGFAALNAIAYGAGPGAFTGIRVACGLAQGLAYGLSCPLIALSSLETLAEGICDQLEPLAGQRVLTVLDARMGEIYRAVLEREGRDWRWVEAPALVQPEDLDRMELQIDYALGDGFRVHGLTRVRPHWCPDAPQEPTARAMLRLALERYQGGRTLPPGATEILYVRDKVALTSAERSLGRG